MIEQTPGRPLLPGNARHILVELWRRVQYDGPAVTRVDVRDAARRIVLDARAELNVADLIAALKLAWFTAGPREALIARPRFNESMLTELISMCVTEYCREHRDDPPVNPLATRWHSPDAHAPEVPPP